jgi:hypothetical protein
MSIQKAKNGVHVRLRWQDAARTVIDKPTIPETAWTTAALAIKERVESNIECPTTSGGYDIWLASFLAFFTAFFQCAVGGG